MDLTISLSILIMTIINIIIWRKTLTVPLETSTLSSIAFVKQIMIDTNTSIGLMISYQQGFADKLTALITAVQAGGAIPQTVTDAMTDLVASSKTLSAGQAMLAEIPATLDQAIAGLTPVTDPTPPAAPDNQVVAADPALPPTQAEIDAAATVKTPTIITVKNY